MSPRIVPQHEQHYPDHKLPTRLQEYVFDDGRPPTLIRKAGAKPVTVSEILNAVGAAQAETKLTDVGLEYYVGTAFHEAGCLNEWDTEIATPSSPRGFMSVGLYQIGVEEAAHYGFTLEDMLDLYKATVCIMKLAADHRRNIRQMLRLGASQPDPDYTAGASVYPGGQLRAYLALYHNMGGGACSATIARYGADWIAYMQRNPTNNLVAHQYGLDCITGGPEYARWKAGVAAGTGGTPAIPVQWTRDLKYTDPHMIGSDVARLQRALNNHASSLQLHDDGEFGHITEQGLQHVQHDLGMPPTGVCTQADWNVIVQ